MSRPRSRASSPTSKASANKALTTEAPAIRRSSETDITVEMADQSDIEAHKFELEELANQPGTYFNPQTEVVVIVDDSFSLDQEIFNMEAYEGTDWVRISDEVSVDEARLDEALETFQTHYHAGGGGSISATALDQDDGEEDEGEEGQEPGRED